MGHLNSYLNCLQIETVWFYDAVMYPKDADEMKNSVDPDHTALEQSYLIGGGRFRILGGGARFRILGGGGGGGKGGQTPSRHMTSY